MPTQNLFDPITGKRKSQAPLVLRTILIVILALAILGSAGANGYFYLKNQEMSKRLAEMQEDIRSIKNENGNGPDLTRIESALDSIDRKLDAVDSEVGEVKSDVDDLARKVSNIESDVSSIESDVSSIQLKIGF